MLSSSVVVGPDRPTTGPASIAQGVYGARGNLELLALDETDGLWVFWFNADLAGDPDADADVPSGTWSAGLHFAGGARYTDAAVFQSTLGPDHLEVLALDDGGTLQSWYWSPGPGFRRRRRDVAEDVSAFAARHHDGELHVTVRFGRRDSHLLSDGAGYPHRTWSPETAGPAIADDEDARRLIHSCTGYDAGIAEHTARRIVSTRDGGTAELIWRDAHGALRHLGVPLG